MKNKTTFVTLFVFAACLMLSQNAKAEKTQVLISKTARGVGIESLGDGNELFLVSVGKPAIGIMKSSSATNNGDIWYVVLSGLTSEEKDIKTAGEEPELPKAFSLSQNYPNPFNPSTTIDFQIPEKDGLQTVQTSLKVYDIRGRLAKTLMEESLAPGFYSVHWDGLKENGERISSGIYFYTISAGDFREIRKMIVLK